MKKKLYVYWLIYISTDSDEIVKEQLDLLLSSGLYDSCFRLIIGIISDEDSYIKTKNYINEKIDQKVEFLHSKENVGESLILKKLYNDCKSFSEENYVLYFHTKGSSIDSNIRPKVHFYKFLYRKFMEYFLIKKWKDCIYVLDNDLEISVCCVFLRNLKWGENDLQEQLYLIDKPFFNRKYKIEQNRWESTGLRAVGNFWWVRSTYIKNMSSECGLMVESLNKIKRYNHEKFIMQGVLPFYVYSFCDIKSLCKPLKCKSENEDFFTEFRKIFVNLVFDLLS